LEKLTRSVNEERPRKPAREELSYAIWVAQRRKPGLMDVAGVVLGKRRQQPMQLSSAYFEQSQSDGGRGKCRKPAHEKFVQRFGKPSGDRQIIA